MGAPGAVGIPFTLPSGAIVTVNTNGKYSYNPNGKFETLALGDTATDKFTYTITDAHGASSTETVTVTIQGANDAPVVANPIADQTVAEEGTVSFAFPANTFSDADGGSLTYTTSALPSWLNFTPATRTFSGTAPVDFNGFLDITVTATDPSVIRHRTPSA